MHLTFLGYEARRRGSRSDWLLSFFPSQEPSHRALPAAAQSSQGLTGSPLPGELPGGWGSTGESGFIQNPAAGHQGWWPASWFLLQVFPGGEDRIREKEVRGSAGLVAARSALQGPVNLLLFAD